jgi:hypothetical protein
MSLEQFIWPGLVLAGTAAAAGGYFWLSRSRSKSSPLQQSSSKTAPSKTPAVASDNDWTRAAAPLVRVVSNIAPGQPYLWAPRLSEFMAVEERYRGTEKAVAETQRLRNYRAGLVFMNAASVRPKAALLVEGQDNSVAISLFDRIGLAYAVVRPWDEEAIRAAVQSFGLISVSKPAETPAKPKPMPDKPSAAPVRPEPATMSASLFDDPAILDLPQDLT